MCAGSFPGERQKAAAQNNQASQDKKGQLDIFQSHSGWLNYTTKTSIKKPGMTVDKSREKFICPKALRLINLEKNMREFMGYTEDILSKIQKTRVSPPVWLLGFSGIVLARLFFDNFLAFSGRTRLGNPTDLHNILFFLISILLVWIFSAFFFKRVAGSLSGLFLWGSFVIIFPPLMDMLKSGGEVFWSPYIMGNPKSLWLQFKTFLGDFPPGIVYFGTRIIIAVVVGSFFVAALSKTRSLFKAIGGALAVYCIFFFMASFPSWLFYVITFFAGGSIGETGSAQIAQFFGAPKMIFGLTFAENPKDAFSYNLNFAYFLLLLFLLAGMIFLDNRRKFPRSPDNLSFRPFCNRNGTGPFGLSGKL